MSGKGLEKGVGGCGRGKEPFPKSFLPLPRVSRSSISGNLAPYFARRSGRVQSYTPLASRLQNPTLPRTASANGKEYRIMMVRFEEPSNYGIRQGRISKLWMSNVKGGEFIKYDRGWDMRPATTEAKAVLAAISKKFN